MVHWPPKSCFLDPTGALDASLVVLVRRHDLLLGLPTHVHKCRFGREVPMAISQEQGRSKCVHLQAEEPVAGSGLDVADMVGSLCFDRIMGY